MNKHLNIFSPSSLFIFIIFIGLLLPSFLIWALDYNEYLRVSVNEAVYREASYLNFLYTSISFFCIYFARYLFSVNNSSLLSKVIVSYDRGKPLSHITGYFLVRLMVLVSLIFLLIYIKEAGFNKILSLGSSMSSSDFRFYNSFDDVNRAAKSLLQVTRRLLLPYAVVFLLATNIIIPVRRNVRFTVIIMLSLSVIITLDRAPLMMMFVMYLYLYLLAVKKPIFTIFKILPLAVCSLIFLGGAMTYIQYNITNVDIETVLNSGFYFLWHRVGAAPSIAAIELSFIEMLYQTDYLSLKYSRLAAVFGGGYVGTNSDTSIFVAPVGYVGDLWRNFGPQGVVIGSLSIGLLLRKFDRLIINMNYPNRAAMTFTVLTLGFYLTHGGLFSQGVFVQIFFILLFPFFCRIK